jgi:hypothetical protein
VNPDTDMAARKTEEQIERETIASVLRSRADEKSSTQKKRAASSRSQNGFQVPQDAVRAGPGTIAGMRSDGASPVDASAHLWHAVLKRAVDDLRQTSGTEEDDAPSVEDRDDALLFFMSEDTDPGSYAWVCEALGLSQWRGLATLKNDLEAARVDRLRREERAREEQRGRPVTVIAPVADPPHISAKKERAA